MEVKKNDQEIDLLTLLVRVLDFVWANLFLTIFLPVAGALVGWGLSHVAENRSESQMMIVTEQLSEQQCEFLLTQLEKTDSFPGISEQQHDGLIALKHKVVNDQRPFSIFNQPQPSQKTHIEITLRLRHMNLRKEFESAIIRYLEASQPAIRKKEELEEYYRVMIAQIERELASMDELKKQIAAKNLPLESSDLYTKSIELMEKKIRFQQASRNIEAFQIVKGFDEMSHPKKASPVQFTLIGMAAGSVLLIIMLFLKYFIAFYRRYHQKEGA